MGTLRETNEFAIKMLEEGQEIISQEIFRNNVRARRCGLTLNNLGVFYSQYGMLYSNKVWKSAKKIGLRYLLQAVKEGGSWQSYASAATAIEEFGNDEFACQLLFEANRLKPDALTQYNAGVCLFRQGRLLDAMAVFERLQQIKTINNIVENGGQNPILITAYLHYLLNEINATINNIHSFRNTWPAEDKLDVFYLRYSCGLYSEALTECVDLLSEWYPTRTMLAMIAVCVKQEPRYLEMINSVIPSDFVDLWEKLKTNYPMCLEAIAEYEYVPPYISLYYYIR